MPSNVVVASGLAHLHDGQDLLIGKSGSGMGLASGLSRDGKVCGNSSFELGISHVLKSGAEPKMLWVYAKAIIATVANILSIRKFSGMKNVAGNVCANASLSFNASANGGVFGIFHILAKHSPTAVGFNNLFHKPFGKCFSYANGIKKFFGDGFWVQSKVNKLFVGHGSFEHVMTVGHSGHVVKLNYNHQ